MFNDLLNDTVRLSFPSGVFVDGAPLRAQCQADAFVFNHHQRVLREAGVEQHAKFFIIAATAETREAFAIQPLNVTLTHNGESYDLKSVRPCRDLDGIIQCFSCAGV